MRQGLAPLKAWVKAVLDRVIGVCFGSPDCEFFWVGDDAVDPLQQAQTIAILVGAGVKTIAEARAELGLGGAAGIVKYNPYHDERGRFTTAEGAGEPGAHQHRKPDRGVEVAENERGPTTDAGSGGSEDVAIGGNMSGEPFYETPKVEPANPIEPVKPDTSSPKLTNPLGPWQPPDAAFEKIPSDWDSPMANKKGEGVRWADPQDPKANGVRIDPGDPNSSLPSQMNDHVVIRSGGKVLGQDGNPISGSIADDPVNAHIPLGVWLKWRYWNRP